MYSSNSQCDRQRGIFALSKTFFRGNTDVFQGKMAQRSVKRPTIRVRWELEEYTLKTFRKWRKKSPRLAGIGRGFFRAVLPARSPKCSGKTHIQQILSNSVLYYSTLHREMQEKNAKNALFLRNFYGKARKQGKYCGKNGNIRKRGGATTPRLRRKMLQRRLSSASGQSTSCCERMRTASPVSGCVNASSAAQSCCGAMPHCAE